MSALEAKNKPRKYRGVRVNNGYIHAVCKGFYLGTFITEERAAVAYDKMAKQVFGVRAITNF